MMYIIIPTGIANQFTGKAKRKGIVLNWKAIKPIPVFEPKNKLVLNVNVLEDTDILEAFPQLSALPQKDESEIEFFEYDIDGNILNK